MNLKRRKQVKVGSDQENQMVAIVKKAVSFRIDKTYHTLKACAEAALDNFKENSGIDPFVFTTVDCVAHHVGTLEKLHETGIKPASGKSKNIQTIIIEKIYPETYGKLPQKTVEDCCDLEHAEEQDTPADIQDIQEHGFEEAFSIIKSGHFYKFLIKCRTVQFDEDGFVTVKARREDWESLF